MIDAPVSLSYGQRIYKPATAPRFIGWRCLHNKEGGLVNNPHEPEVRPSVNAQPVPMTAEIQRLSYELMTHANENVNGASWRAVYGDGVAFCNDNGFNNSLDCRADFVNGLDVSCPLPKLMKALICGGMFIRGEVVGVNLICRPGLHAIDANYTIPGVETILMNDWFFHAVTWDGNKVWNFPQGKGAPVLIPYILKQSVSYPLAWFERWERDTLPDPLTIYNAR